MKLATTSLRCRDCNFDYTFTFYHCSLFSEFIAFCRLRGCFCNFCNMFSKTGMTIQKLGRSLNLVVVDFFLGKLVDNQLSIASVSVA